MFVWLGMTPCSQCSSATSTAPNVAMRSPLRASTPANPWDGFAPAPAYARKAVIASARAASGIDVAACRVPACIVSTACSSDPTISPSPMVAVPGRSPRRRTNMPPMVPNAATAAA